ncbi:MAG: hypothetical protein IJ438_00085 [Clostridia bacterium]|nr:hypothetical protein [Clostridia bacterium]
MKKLLSLLVSLTLCLCAAAMAETEAELPTMEIAPSYEAYTLPLGESGFTLDIPGEWLVYEDLPEGAVALFSDEDQAILLQVNIVEMDIASIAAEVVAQAENNEIKDLFECMINKLYYLTYTSLDDTMNIAYAPLTDTHSIVFIFTTSDPARYAESTLPLEIIGSIALAETAE